MGTNLPAGFFTNKPGPLAGAGLAAMEQDRIAKLEFPGALPPETLTILDGSISPTRAAVVVDTEGGAPADDLAVISTTLSDGTTLHDGMELIIQAKDQSRVVTVKSSAAVNGILTADGKDVVLGTDWWLTLRLESGSWRVVNLAQPQKVASKTNLGAMQVGQHLEVTPEGVVDAPVASESKQGIGRSATTAEVESGVTGENGPAWVTPEQLRFIEEWRKSWIGVPRFWRSTTLPPNHAWPDGSFISFADWPEFKEVYDTDGFAGMLMPWDADSATQAANLGKFRPDAATPTGLYLPLHGNKFFRAWVLGTDREAGGWQEDALQGHVHGYGGASERQNYVNVPTMLSVVPIDNNSTVSMTNAQKQAYVSDGAHGTPRIASDTRPENTIVPVILYLGQPK